MHDQYHQASFILDKVRRATPYVDSMSYWTFTDIFEENGPRFTPFHGGFGMINLEGIKKPSFYAFKFLGELGKVDVESDDAQSWVTKSPDGSVRALVWDYSPVVPPQGQVDQTFYQQRLPPTDKGSVELEISHVPDGDYSLAVYQIGYKQNDAYTAYLELGAPSQLTREQVRALNDASAGAPIMQAKVTVTGGRFVRTVPLRSNDVFLFVLTPVKARRSR
jgi:xylan 1,4-beta-xylosidase